MEGGAREVVIVQMPSRSGFSDFMSLLSKYREEGRLGFSLEGVSEEHYQAALRVHQSETDSSLLVFPQRRALAGKVLSEVREEGQGRRVMTTAREEFALLKIWNSQSDGSCFPSAALTSLSPAVASSTALHDLNKVDAVSEVESNESSVPLEHTSDESDAGSQLLFPPFLARVATFNLNARSKNLPHFLEVLTHLDLDIICLQECPHDLAMQLKRGLGTCYTCVYATADFCGNALLTRLPVLRHWTVEMNVESGMKSAEMRSAAVAVVALDVKSAGGGHCESKVITVGISLLVYIIFW